MKLYLVQHAKAASEQEDPRRSLTEAGRKESEKAAAFARPLNLCVGCIWHSSKRRAAQTAEILAEAVTSKEGSVAREALGPNDDVTPVARELGAAEKDVMIVGHLPFLSRLASLLLTGSESGDTVTFRNAGIVCVERGEDGRWHICWVVTPDILG
ncbi:MAG TPA: phosphohistidine phosphatase SixA [Sedimentisphaerales bacterium]|nr:phosphohistidine phosphatase SixA [Sedimentisphaerales bacterium]